MLVSFVFLSLLGLFNLSCGRIASSGKSVLLDLRRLFFNHSILGKLEGGKESRESNRQGLNATSERRVESTCKGLSTFTRSVENHLFHVLSELVSAFTLYLPEGVHAVEEETVSQGVLGKCIVVVESDEVVWP